MITLRDLALLEEGRLARSISEIAPECRHLPPEAGGGLFARGVPGTWTNIGVALGLAGDVPVSTVDELIGWHESHGVEPRVELCPFAHPSLVAALAERGFVVRLFESVFFRELSPEGFLEVGHPLPDDIRIVTIDRADDARVRECARVIAAAFAGDAEPAPAAVDLAATCMRHARTTTLAALHDARVVGAGSIEILASASALFGLCVSPDFRRRGIQQALIAARLRFAADCGVTLATISARPGVSTEGNARRMGFQVGYTKAILARPGPGLIPVVD